MENRLAALLEQGLGQVADSELRESIAEARRAVVKLEAQIEMFEDLLARRHRRTTRTAATRKPQRRTRRASNQGQFKGTSRHEVYAALKDQRGPLRAPAVHEFLIEKGFDVTLPAVQTAMNRLEKDGKLRRERMGEYFVNVPLPNGDDPSTSADAESPLSRASSVGSQGS